MKYFNNLRYVKSLAWEIKNAYVTFACKSVAAVSLVTFAKVAALKVEATGVLVTLVLLEGAFVNIQAVFFIKAEHVSLTASEIGDIRSYQDNVAYH